MAIEALIAGTTDFDATSQGGNNRLFTVDKVWGKIYKHDVCHKYNDVCHKGLRKTRTRNSPSSFQQSFENVSDDAFCIRHEVWQYGDTWKKE